MRLYSWDIIHGLPVMPEEDVLFLYPSPHFLPCRFANTYEAFSARSIEVLTLACSWK